MKSLLAVLCLLPSLWIAASAEKAPHVIENVVVYRDAGRYGGWPANHGVWSWGNEILVGFSAAYYQKKSPDRHQYDSSRPEEPRLARSLDDGRTWSIEAPRSLLPPEQGGAAVTALLRPMDFQAPGFAMTLRFTDTNRGPSRLFYSTDRGKTWNGPYAFPLFGQIGIAARTDYVVNGPHDAFAFITASKRNGKEGRPLCVRTVDGGLNWKFVSWIGPEPEGFAIMPSTVRLSDQEMITAVRVKQDPDRDWIDLYRTLDNGLHWRYVCRPVPDTGGHGGNPPSMIRLQDGRICLTYGYRARPWGVRARLSADSGKTWGREIVLRADAASWEVGYTRTVQRSDGKLVTVYYFPDPVTSAHIVAATIWDPNSR